jgi:predicted DNA-binding protein (MmcQ/YjbR family)
MISRLEQLRTFCQQYEGTSEEFPWGHETPVFKNPKGKIFAMSGETDDGTLTVTVKLTPEEGSAALSLPFVIVARYVGRYGWVTATVSNDAEMDAALEWVAHSHALVGPKRKKSEA